MLLSLFSRRLFWTLSLCLLLGCQQDQSDSAEESLGAIDGVSAALLPTVALDQRLPEMGTHEANPEAPVPPMCYTKTEGRHNPCYVCHQVYPRNPEQPRMNMLDDGGIQGSYLFSDEGLKNHWANLFVDRSEWLAQVSDEAIVAYTNQDNYQALPARLQKQGWEGFVPDLANFDLAAAAFDKQGFARDGSGWVAFNYKPLPSTFWPTNGNTDDVAIRLPEKFRQVDGKFSRAVYQLNLALAELSIKQLPRMRIHPSDEQLHGRDLDGDGQLRAETQWLAPQSHFFGDAKEIAVLNQQFPKGTEFIHSVRYVGVDTQGNISVPRRMKELRYMQKIRELTASDLDNRYRTERKEKVLGELPYYVDHGDKGRENGMGWLLTGFIEDYQGALRPQTREEMLFCMGCHAAIGTTIDQTFAFSRKVTGPEGWGYINLRGMTDAPSVNQHEGEILQYLKRVGGGSEFRENPEMLQRWYNSDGSVKEAAVQAADVYTLITPSRERALAMNKAYSHIVRHQSFVQGRDATWLPANNVHRQVEDSTPPLDAEYRFFGWDMRLDWSATQNSVAHTEQ
ncbi:hypothetical protein Mag101_17070 [Microbulbifer agarilyticus]|uniref:Uncharacterized protein n=1 Tax=Microbulbifer agarilyticus TaxID=260552 RepID=A0A1Q2MAB6_9GAMM|nr:hypothetical protein [Microbulbifer agarilyticus]AQQ69152.1 hypothetical protein Mag101_17070 [Microbulbifer agarilyticus]